VITVQAGDGQDREAQVGLGNSEKSSIGSVSVGGKKFDLPEHAVILL
jgi:hypothetical protein